MKKPTTAIILFTVTFLGFVVGAYAFDADVNYEVVFTSPARQAILLANDCLYAGGKVQTRRNTFRRERQSDFDYFMVCIVGKKAYVIGNSGEWETNVEVQKL